MPLRYYGSGFGAAVDKLADCERVGLDRIMIAEAYTVDAVSQMGYVAAKTQRVELTFGVLPMYSRTQTNLAMTAAVIDYVSGGRCVLGIGASGPQVIEGFHGVKYDAPVERAREHADICRKIWRRELSEYDGKHYVLPLGAEAGGSGLGTPLRIIGSPCGIVFPWRSRRLGHETLSSPPKYSTKGSPYCSIQGGLTACSEKR